MAPGDGLFVDEATSGGVVVVVDGADELADDDGVAEAVALEFCCCNRLRRRSRVSLKRP